MAIVPRDYLKRRFSGNFTPTQKDYEDLIDTCFSKFDDLDTIGLGPYDPNGIYEVGNTCVYLNDIYMAVNDSTNPAGTFAPGDWIVISSSMGVTTIGNPTDGFFGESGGVSGLLTTDILADGFDKIETVLEKLVPATPPLLSATTLELQTSVYTAKPLSSNLVVSNVAIDTQAMAQSDERWWNAISGTLTAEIDGVDTGSIVLDNTLGQDSGAVNGDLILVDKNGFPVSGAGANFWKAALSQIDPAAPLTPRSNAYLYRLKHTLSGNTPILTWYLDNPAPVSIANETCVPGGSLITKYISGVPSYDTGSEIDIQYDVVDGASYFWHGVRVGSASGTALTSFNLNPLAAPVAVGDITVVGTTTVSTGYTEALTPTVVGYNSRAGSVIAIGTDTASTTIPTTIRVDTVSSETNRKTSGVGQYPGSGYGGAYISTDLLSTNEELLILNGIHRYPNHDFTANLPAGPNYLALTGSYSTYRWVTYSLGSKTDINFIKFQIQSATGFGSLALVPDLIVQVRVDGGVPTTGWVDGNAAYASGNPTANGDPALDMSASTATIKRVTFGTATKTGIVYVRIGIPSGSTKTFGNIVEI